MKDYYLTNAEIKRFYFKRWSALSVKILRVIDVIQSTPNEHTRHYLRTYKEELNTIKETEKKETINLI